MYCTPRSLRYAPSYMSMHVVSRPCDAQPGIKYWLHVSFAPCV
jgi:hypothetical protein